MDQSLIKNTIFQILLSHAIKSRIRLSISGFDMRGMESKNNSTLNLNDQAAKSTNQTNLKDSEKTASLLKSSPKKADSVIKEHKTTFI